MAVFGKKLCELPSIFAIMLCVRFITAIREDIMEKTQQYSTPYEFEGKLPLRQAIPLGLQHVLAMFVGNLTPILIITSLCAPAAVPKNLRQFRCPCFRTLCWWQDL